MEADLAFRLFQGSHQLPDGFDERDYFLIVSADALFQLGELAGQLAIGFEHFARRTKARVIATFTLPRVGFAERSKAWHTFSVKANGRYGCRRGLCFEMPIGISNRALLRP